MFAVMQLFKSYLRENGLTLAQMARRCGIAPNYLSEIVSGHKVPSLHTAAALCRETDQTVPVSYWLDPAFFDAQSSSDQSLYAIPPENSTKE